MSRNGFATAGLVLLAACNFSPIAALDIDAGGTADAAGDDSGDDAGATPADTGELDTGIPRDAMTSTGAPDAGDAAEPDADPADVDPGDVIDPDADEDDAGEADAADAGAPDAQYPTIPHLGPADQIFGSGDYLIPAGTIDTDMMTVPGMLPSGATFTARPQSPSGPGVAVLRAGAVTIGAGVVVSVIGERPLIIVADGRVEIAGTLDASAQHEVPGAGGSDPLMGPGAGDDGESAGSYGDSGGGGGGFGSTGGRGGFAENMNASPGAAGMEHGDQQLSTLSGGSGGGFGAGGVCLRAAPGAGGGAVQIYSTDRILVSGTGAIAAGGGGGRGGIGCASNAGAGSGGGSGGAIYLMAPDVEIGNNAAVAANGGGGGGGASGTTAGGTGEDGRRTGTAANGGGSGGRYGNPGGSGAYESTGAANGGDEVETGTSGGNSGGGGGGVGRIVIVAGNYQNQGVVTPDPHTLPY